MFFCKSEYFTYILPHTVQITNPCELCPDDQEAAAASLLLFNYLHHT